MSGPTYITLLVLLSTYSAWAGDGEDALERAKKKAAETDFASAAAFYRGLGEDGKPEGIMSPGAIHVADTGAGRNSTGVCDPPKPQAVPEATTRDLSTEEEWVLSLYRRIPRRNASTDEEQTMSFYLGPVVFQIKNSSLTIPFPKGSHPFDASICSRTDISEIDRKLCVQPKKSVFLRIPVPSDYAGGNERAFVSPVTLGHHQGLVIDERPIDEFAATHNPWEMGRIRVPHLDTEKYAAVLTLPKQNPRTQETRPGSYFFVGKGAQKPHIIYCGGSRDEKDMPVNVCCSARTGFLVDQFPRGNDGSYPFTLAYEFPASELDRAPEIEAAVIKAVSAFPRSAAPPVWPRPE